MPSRKQSVRLPTRIGRLRKKAGPGLTSIVDIFGQSSPKSQIIGFFLPALLGVLALSQGISKVDFPTVYRHASPQAQLAILGGATLIVGWLLQAVHQQVLRLYEGYPLFVRCFPKTRLSRVMVLLQSRHFDNLKARSEDDRLSERERFDLRWRLDRHFPGERDLILPTSFGNAVRAAERHSWVRWHLNSVVRPALAPGGTPR